MTTDQRYSPRAIKGDSNTAHNGYVLTTVGGVPAWLPTGSLPAGGTTGQVLTKLSGTDFDAAWAAPSGGGSTAGGDRRWNVGSGETTVDEFDDAILDAAWTRVDASGGSGRVTWTEDGGTLSVATAGGDAASELHGIVRPLSGVGGSLATGDGFVTFVSHLVNPNWFGAGLILSDGTTHGAGNQVLGAVLSDNSVSIRPFTNWNTQGTIGTVLAAARGNMFYMRLIFLGSGTWRCDVSTDDVSWFKGGNLSKTMTATHVGFLVSSFGTATKGVGGFQFLRRVSGVT